MAVALLAGGASPVEFASNVQPAWSVGDRMMDELRSHLQKFKASDDDLMDAARAACEKLSRVGRDDYREGVLEKYDDDVTQGLDHLTVAAAGKTFLCP
jgi:hypothetical protein